MHSCITQKETNMTKVFEITADDIPDEVRDALKELAGILGKTADKADAKAKFKSAIGEAAAEALTENGLPPESVVEGLLTLAAITLNVYLDPKEGIDPRKGFKKLAGLAHDRAKRIQKIVDKKDAAAGDD